MTKDTTAPAAKTFQTDADFTTARGLIHAAADTVQMDIQRYLVGVAVSWQGTGDIRPAVLRVNTLLDGLPRGLRSNAIREWVELYFGFTIPDEGDNKGVFIAGKVKGAALDIPALSSKRWFEVKAEAPYKPMDFGKDLAAMLKKAGARVDATTKGDHVDGKLLAAVQAAVASHAAQRAADSLAASGMPVAAE